MVHKDKIITELEFSHEGVFDFKEFLHMIKSFFSRYNYDFDEKVYESKNKGDLKTTRFKWAFDRKLDDYNKAVVKLGIGLEDYKEGYSDGIKIVDGKLKVKFDAEVERDYNEDWKKQPTKKFIRAVFDKYVSAHKQKKVDDSVKDLVENLRREIKQYFKA